MPGVASNDPTALDHGLPSHLEFLIDPERRVRRDLLDARVFDDARDRDQRGDRPAPSRRSAATAAPSPTTREPGSSTSSTFPTEGPARGGDPVRQGDRPGPGVDQHHRGAEPDLQGDQLTRSWLMSSQRSPPPTAAPQPAGRGRTGDARADVDRARPTRHSQAGQPTWSTRRSSSNSPTCSTGPTRPRR